MRVVKNRSTRVVKTGLTRVVKNGQTPAVKNALTLVLLGLLVTFLGCGKSGENKPASSNEPARSTGSGPQTGSPANAPATAPVAPAAVAIVTADGEKPGTRFEITELKRSSDNNLTLKFALVNDGPDKLSFGYDYGDEGNHIKDYDSNQKLSERRAASVKTWFIDKEGLSSVQFTTQGFGAKKPVASNTKTDGSDDPDGRQKNRRV